MVGASYYPLLEFIFQVNVASLDGPKPNEFTGCEPRVCHIQIFSAIETAVHRLSQMSSLCFSPHGRLRCVAGLAPGAERAW